MVWNLISSFDGETIIGVYGTAVIPPSFSYTDLVCLEVENNIELELDGTMAPSLQLPSSSSLQHLI